MNTFAKAGLSSSQILTTLRTQGIETTLTSKDVSNVPQKMRTEELNGISPIRWLLQVIHPSFQNDCCCMYT
ncbi:hypothetical protein GcM1_011002 [Golovinomyces cichoracearum]|uniref:Uncharacterized protein n=1 Tax=Golovinomyces cichoracearum TaxID=62708 RepID=A0A420JCK8_9PEZI|nr:hypothetical protein GcM1_011002 [Golovinomyces cichoracearum]